MNALIEISERELVDLIRFSAGRVVACAMMRAGGVKLNIKESPWAVALLLEWRGIMFVDGGGI